MLSNEEEYPRSKKKGTAETIEIDENMRIVRTGEWDIVEWGPNKEAKFWIPKKDTVKGVSIRAGGRVGLIGGTVGGVYKGEKERPRIIASGTLTIPQVAGIAESVSGTVGYLFKPQEFVVYGYCPVCNRNLPEPNLNYCPYCGNKLQP